jgi:hypothetical protein
MNTEDILDTRTSAQFYEITFSGYERKRVKQLLEMALYEGQLDKAVMAMVELVCAGHFNDIWQTCLLVYLRFVHLNSINFLVFFHQSWLTFRKIVGQNKKSLSFRNHSEIRLIIYKIVGLLTLLPKHAELVSFYKYKIIQEDFDSAANLDKYHAGINYLPPPLFTESDPTELYYPLNELYYHLKVTQNRIQIYYWLDFLLEYYTKNKELACFQKPEYLDTEMIWLIWDIFRQILSEKRRLSWLENLQTVYEICRKKRQPFPIFYYFLVELILAPTHLKASNIPQLESNLPPFPIEAYIEIKQHEIMTGSMDKHKMSILWDIS